MKIAAAGENTHIMTLAERFQKLEEERETSVCDQSMIPIIETGIALPEETPREDLLDDSLDDQETADSYINFHCPLDRRIKRF